MKVKYEEGAAALLVEAAGREVKRGEEAEVPSEAGKQLLAQGWVEAKSPSQSHSKAAKAAHNKESK